MSPIEAAISGILLDYKTGRDIDAAADTIPDKKAVTQLIQQLMSIIFPAYHQGDAAEAVRSAASLLCQLLPEETAARFLQTIPSLRAVIQTDVEAAFDGDPAATDCREIILCYPGLFATTVHRLAHLLQMLDVARLPRMMTEYAHSLTGIDIHPGAQIGKYFFIDHGTGIVIGETTIIGDHVKIYQGVTLGGLSTRGGQRLKGRKRHPTIEDDVTIYANASILGGDTVIGKGCVIGASAFITDSIPPHTTVTSKCQKLQLRSITTEPKPDGE